MTERFPRSGRGRKRKEAEAALRVSENTLRVVFDNIYDGILLHAPDGAILDVNETFLNMYAVSREQVLRLKIGDISAPSMPLASLPSLWSKVMSGEPQLFEWKARRVRDGSEFDVEVFLRRVRVRDREAILANLRDVTHRKEAESSLRESEERFRLATHAAKDAVWDWNLETDHIAWNEAVALLFGYSEALAGTTVGWWEERVHPEDRPRVVAVLRALIEGGGTVWKEEYRFQRADGSWAYVLDRGSVLRRPDGSPSRMVGALLDLTERMETEQDLRAAKEAAEAGNRAKDRFLVNMSHELRTPLTVTMGMLELALLENPPPALRRYIEGARQSSEALLALIGDLLDLSRIEKGEPLLREELFDLRRCVDDAVGRFRPRAEEKGIGLRLEIDPGIPRQVFGDCGRLIQILENLVGNAVRFTERGQVEITVAPEGTPGGDGPLELRFAVRDSGIGISDEAMGRLFRKFTQIDDSLTRRFGGSGVGLAISRGLVERMGGRIEAKSTVGEGSLFFFVVPFRVAEELFGEEVRKRPATFKDFSVLVAEDDASIAQLVRLMLERQGCKVDIAADGRAALEKWEAGRYDLVLMDLQMPKMDGLEATRIIRRKEPGRGTHTPIVALTAHALEEDEDRCRQAGMDDFLAKPIDMEELYAAVGRCLGRGRA